MRCSRTLPNVLVPYQSKRSVAKKKSSLRIRRVSEHAWELLHPRCATARREDIEEVHKMIAAGETEIACDELRWLLDECHDFIKAHALLGDLAFAENDLKLARGHYGYAYQLGLRVIEQSSDITRLPANLAANEPFFHAGQGLIRCLAKMGKGGLAQEIAKRLIELDPADPLDLRSLLGRPR
jgi:tetratricopeptide (TPR) repeat protein